MPMRLAFTALFAFRCFAAAPQYSAELIFPLEHWHNHSSSVVELPNGDLLVAGSTVRASARPTTF